MCGIIGYVGNNKAAQIILDGLKMLQYRGYDSAGIAFHSGQNVEIYKCVGKIEDLEEMLGNKGEGFSCGFGHTRWATHGSVRQPNAHPHFFGKVTLVHNGIIENYKDLIEKYQLKDRLQTTCDSEVAAALLDIFYDGDPFEAIRKLLAEIRGTYAFVVMFQDIEDTMYAFRKVSPIVACKHEDEFLLASDLMPISLMTDEYFIVPEGAVLVMNREGVKLYDLDQNEISPEYKKIDWKADQFDKKGYPFFMEKEICEQPEAIRRTIEKRIVNGLPDLAGDGLKTDLVKDIDSIEIVACGTSYHAGLAAKVMFEKYAGIRTNVSLASEFIYSGNIFSKKPLFISVSQSGETIDTIEAVKKARDAGYPAIGIINVKDSSLSRICNVSLYTDAGPEIAVASTKAYTCQLSLMYLLAFYIGLVRGKVSEDEVRTLISVLKELPERIKEIIDRKEELHLLAKRFLDHKDLFLIGRGPDYLALLEGALKIKEITYIHAEAYASGELKHGPIALIETGTPVISLMTQDDLMLKESSNVKETRARGAKVLVIIKESLLPHLGQKVDTIILRDYHEDFLLFVAVTVLQMLAYYIAIDKGLDVDKPRNLAKVVTVE
ncbi:MAG: glutamine--fructose-6-phosphate transaminase (isomerizing) [Erysipelotrichaceae bacterium]|nr:glutamine--fructose-6-phosphate transaminase (isomerizing) [Erysipelotrichaceae bacterium]